MSQVYEAVDDRTQGVVALTVLEPPNGGDGLSVLGREHLKLQALTHPQVARVVDLVHVGGHRPCWVTERVPGVDLDHVRSVLPPLSPAHVAVLLTGAGRALDAAHGLGVVHRRLTLRKLVVGRRNDEPIRVMIVGFGAGPLVEPSPDTSRPTIQSDASTATTMAPEAVTGMTSPGSEVDVYALAVLAFELAAGRPPFQDDNPIRLLARKVAIDAPLLREVARTPVAPAFEAAIARALSRDPSERQRSAGELVFDLRRAAEVSGPTTPAFEALLTDTLEDLAVRQDAPTDKHRVV